MTHKSFSQATKSNNVNSEKWQQTIRNKQNKSQTEDQIEQTATLHTFLKANTNSKRKKHHSSPEEIKQKSCKRTDYEYSTNKEGESGSKSLEPQAVETPEILTMKSNKELSNEY